MKRLGDGEVLDQRLPDVDLRIAKASAKRSRLKSDGRGGASRDRQIELVAAGFGCSPCSPQGTARIGALLGPIMTLWFISIGLLGLFGILRHPAVSASIGESCRA